MSELNLCFISLTGINTVMQQLLAYDKAIYCVCVVIFVRILFSLIFADSLQPLKFNTRNKKIIENNEHVFA